MVGSGTKVTGATVLALADKSELADARNGGSVPGVCTMHFEGVTVSSNVKIVWSDAPDDEPESAARLSSSLLTLALLAIWTASV